MFVQPQKHFYPYGNTHHTILGYREPFGCRELFCQNLAKIGRDKFDLVFRFTQKETVYLWTIPSNNPIMEKGIESLTKAIVAFTEERDWDQFHNPKDLALALSIEASELLEAFLWKKPEEARREKVKEELADVINYALLLADKYGFDVDEIVREKLARNAEKYPVEKARGTARKYNEL